MALNRSPVCTMCTSHISLCSPKEAHFWPQGHYLNKLGRDPLDNAALGPVASDKIFMFSLY